MGMTQDQFRKDGWLKHFAMYSEEELATLVLASRCLVEMGLWTDLVRYCTYKIEESAEERILEEAETEVLH
jgi:hypothetical protein|tara:strand:- start:211 stop:423 length:213 start_codon:yes stop_codon:yes gene_type:complete